MASANTSDTLNASNRTSLELEVACQQLLHKTREFSVRVSSFGKTLQAQQESICDQAERLNAEIHAKMDEVNSLLHASKASASPGPLPVPLVASPRPGGPSDVASEASAVAALETARSIFNGNGPGGDLGKYVGKFSRRPLILDYFHGPAAQFVVHRKDQTNKLKEEYRSFRSKCAVIMFGFAAVLQMVVKRSELLREANEELTLLPVVMVGVQLFLCWLLFFYTATALRESVLKINGSRIRPWWIQHHYWSMAACVLMLSLPIDSPAVVSACQLFLWWAMMQGVVMVMQNRYQRRRLYTKIALGNVMSNSSDVIGGETSGSSGQLFSLYPVLFGMQALQFYIGIGMFSKTQWSWRSLEGFLDPERPGTDLWGSRGVALAGIMMMLMALANWINTIQTIVVKGRGRKRR